MTEYPVVTDVLCFFLDPLRRRRQIKTSGVNKDLFSSKVKPSGSALRASRFVDFNGVPCGSCGLSAHCCQSPAVNQGSVRPPSALLSAFRGSRRPTLEKRRSSSSSPLLGRTGLRGAEAFLFNFSNCLSFLLLCVRACVCVCLYVRPLQLRVRSSGRGKAGFLSSAIRNGIHWRAHTTAVPPRNSLLRGATWNFLYSAGPVTRDTCAHTHTLSGGSPGRPVFPVHG